MVEKLIPHYRHLQNTFQKYLSPLSDLSTPPQAMINERLLKGNKKPSNAKNNVFHVELSDP